MLERIRCKPMADEDNVVNLPNAVYHYTDALGKTLVNISLTVSVLHY